MKRIARVTAVVAALSFFVELVISVAPSAQPSESVDAYADPISAEAGSSVDLKISAQGLVTVLVSRLSGLDQQLLIIGSVQAVMQPVPADAYKSGAKWRTTYTLQIPKTWRSGVYSARITNGHRDVDVRFIVRRARRPERLLFLVGTNTWYAYNPWGGGGLYGPKSDGASYDRPVEWDNGNFRFHTVESDRLLAGWLDAQGYTYSVASDLDLERVGDRALAGVKTLIIGSHSEYWTGKMRDALDHFVARGGSLVYLGANALTSHVEFEPNTANMRLINARWRSETPPRPEANVLGIQYEDKGQITCEPYVVNSKHLRHPLLAGTALREGDAFGLGGRIPHEWCPKGKASGWEVDRCPADECGPNVTLLAEAPNKLSQMVFVDGRPSRRGSAFSVGSIHFVGSLAGCENPECVNDRALSRIVNNVLESFGNQH